ncbi:MAG: VWA domain-containing protein [Blastocatellia bacterium]|nr:VWA domain-containing protein [Blastocatellia bacterium]MCS7156924.1 VWA domain-containing protein [Blastocatellia bacterium]MCX7752123.1 VWA domain-containing protein [Blastocatellia bacterium]MDW8167616.1 VWA domain-containing protein [Acidobacteriota bacterium]MDW8256216.1 VWA domain-containing protein [Acidobacteriota bacterium]
MSTTCSNDRVPHRAGDWPRRSLIFGILIGLGISFSGAFAQRPKSGEEPIVELRSDLVSFTVSVIGPKGESVPHLTREDFRVYEDGEQQQISHFATVEAPVDIVLLLDTSGSMRGELKTVQRAAMRFIERMRPQDRVAIVEFNREAVLHQDFTQERKQAIGALRNLKAGSATAFYDALAVVADELLRSASGRKVIVALTDGVDSASFYDFSEAAKRLEQAAVAVYVIELDTEAFVLEGIRRGELTLSPAQLERYRRTYRPRDLPLRYRNPFFFTEEELMEITRGLYRLARRELRELAERTGGRVYPLSRLSQLDEVYAKIQAELGTLYSIGYYPSRQERDGRWRSLRVEVTVPGARVHARSGYWAPSK